MFFYRFAYYRWLRVCFFPWTTGERISSQSWLEQMRMLAKERSLTSVLLLSFIGIVSLPILVCVLALAFTFFGFVFVEGMYLSKISLYNLEDIFLLSFWKSFFPLTFEPTPQMLSSRSPSSRARHVINFPPHPTSTLFLKKCFSHVPFLWKSF